MEAVITLSILFGGILFLFLCMFLLVCYADRHMTKERIKEIILYHEDEIEKHRLEIYRLNKRLESM